MKILYGTTNQGKLEVMRRNLSPLPQIELVSLKDMINIPPLVEEWGNTPLENARIKARAYYRAFQMPVFSCDTGLYFENLPQNVQPGIHVRHVKGRCLSDEEMTVYYSGLAEKYGDITARYRNAICLVWDGHSSYESMEESLSGEAFLLTAHPHPKRQPGFPLDCLSKDIQTGAYYYDLGKNRQDAVALSHGFLSFFQQILKEKSKTF